MLKFLREKLFGFTSSQRAGSVQVSSKNKPQPANRPNSIQSKPKLLNQKLRKTPIQEIQILQDLKDPNTERKVSRIKQFSNDFEDTISMAISQDNFQIKQEQNLLEGLDEEVKIQKNKPVIITQALSIANKKAKVKKFHMGEKQITPQFFSKNNQTLNTRKVLIKSVVSNKHISKIYDQCAVCKERLIGLDSCQLACTHRYHKSCAVTMQWKMKYTCDLCTNRYGKKQVNRK